MYTNCTTINVRTDVKVKNKSQEIAKELGFSLSAVINAYLRQFIRTKSVNFCVFEEPSEYLKQSLKKSEREIKDGFVSPGFTKANEAIEWLHKSKKKYANKV